MWDSVREWGLAVFAILGAIFTPVAYVMNIRADIRVLKAEVDSRLTALERQVALESAERQRGENETKAWLLRVEAKLDKVLFGHHQE